MGQLRTLNLLGGDALCFSLMGFGAAPLGNMHRALKEDEAVQVVEAAWEAGARYFDTAPLYGHGLSENRLGLALQDKPRSSFLLSTKVGRVLDPCAPGQEESGIYVDTPALRVAYDYSYDGVMRSFEESRGRLAGLSVDMLFIHDLDATTHGDREELYWRDFLQGGGWRALEELRRSGEVKAIGAGMNECAPCERLLEEADPDLFLLAGRLTLLDQSALQSLAPQCVARGVGLIIGGVFNSGILATGAVAGARFAYRSAPELVLERVRVLEKVCAMHEVNLADAALQFPLAHDGVVCVLQGGQTVEHVKRNAASFASKLPDAFWTELASLGIRTGRC